MDYDKLYGDIPDKPKKKQLEPLKGASAKEQFKEMEPEVIEALRRVINDTDSSGSSVVSAAAAVLDRALGKQSPSASADADNKLEVTIIHQCPDCQKTGEAK